MNKISPQFERLQQRLPEFNISPKWGTTPKQCEEFAKRLHAKLDEDDQPWRKPPSDADGVE